MHHIINTVEIALLQIQSCKEPLKHKVFSLENMIKVAIQVDLRPSEQRYSVPWHRSMMRRSQGSTLSGE